MKYTVTISRDYRVSSYGYFVWVKDENHHSIDTAFTITKWGAHIAAKRIIKRHDKSSFIVERYEV